MPRKSVEKEEKITKTSVEKDTKIKTSIEMRSLIVTILLLGLLMFFISFANLFMLINQNNKLDDIEKALSSNQVEPSKKEQEQNKEYDVSMFNELTGKEAYDYLKNSSGYKVFYSGRATCAYCVQFLPYLQQSLEEYDIEVVYVDLTKMKQEDYDALSQFGGVFRQYDQSCTTNADSRVGDSDYCGRIGSTPIMVIFKDGKSIGGQMGYSEYNTWKGELDRVNVKKR